LLLNQPDWFSRLGTGEGIDQFESEHGISVPSSLRLFYRYPATACWLAIRHDTDVFLAEFHELGLPLLVSWYYCPHLVIGELASSQIELAVELNSDRPRIQWGEIGAAAPLRMHCLFDEWLTGVAQKILGELDH
jgi:hypothetical protein